jgi:hydrogenase small subunit
VRITRRDYLRASTAAGLALGLKASGMLDIEKAWAAGTKPVVLWLQAQGCTGCSVSFLNSIYYATVDTLLTQTLDVQYHTTVMAGAGQMAVNAANAARSKGNYILVVNGAIPTGAAGKYCMLWPGMTALDGVKKFAANASYVIAVGTCASFGGIPGAAPNPTAAKSVGSILGATPKLINIPGCPAHPDWLVGTVSYILTNGAIPALDSQRRPTTYFSRTVHDRCPRQDSSGSYVGGPGCMYGMGCKGPRTHCDCPARMWNGAAAGQAGVNWCIGASTPCHGCTEPTFPDGMDPFLTVNNSPGSYDD